MTPQTALLPVAVCEGVVQELDREPRADPVKAEQMASRLLGCYPALKAHDPEVYATAIVAAFCAYPESVGWRVADPLQGLASRLKFDPKVADVIEALEAEMRKRHLIRANALWHIQEREERARVAEAEREFAASRLSAAERKALAEKLLGNAFNSWPDKG